MRELIRDQRGGAFTVVLLLIIPLFIAGIMLTLEQPRMIHGADNDLQHAVAEATRAAAMCVNKTAQANGVLRIDPDRAHETFKRVLAYNLGLSDVTLEPLKGSGMSSKPSYVLVVYNGDDTYTPGAYEYRFINGSYSDGPLPFDTLPKDFSIDVDSITYGPGERTVTLDNPGCVAVIRQSILPVATQNAAEAIRWASAKVVHK